MYYTIFHHNLYAYICLAPIQIYILTHPNRDIKNFHIYIYVLYTLNNQLAEEEEEEKRTKMNELNIFKSLG